MNFSKNKVLTRFEIKPEYDIEGYEQIIKTSPIDVRPSNLLNNRIEIVDAVGVIFTDDAVLIRRRVSEIEIAWKKIEPAFINLSLFIFNSKDIPDETYVCYPTICPMISRDPIKHRVAFPYDSKDSVACYVIAHEFLHEFFYHHLYNLFGDEIDLNRRDIWDLSEIVAVLIMQEKEWNNVFHVDAKPYDVHKELFLSIKPMWDMNKNLDFLLKKFL